MCWTKRLKGNMSAPHWSQSMTAGTGNDAGTFLLLCSHILVQFFISLWEAAAAAVDVHSSAFHFLPSQCMWTCWRVTVEPQCINPAWALDPALDVVLMFVSADSWLVASSCCLFIFMCIWVHIKMGCGWWCGDNPKICIKLYKSFIC